MFKLVITVLSLTPIIGVLPLPSLKHLPPDKIETLAELETDHKQRMWELSGKFEGDMILLQQQRNGLVDESFRWDENVIPYELDPAFTKAQVDTIEDTVKVFAEKSCLTVKRRFYEKDYVYITGNNTGCWSHVGRIGGKQEMNLDIDCIYKHTIIHEFLHAAGFYHQHIASNRDDYITINWGNIQPGEEDKFDKLEGNGTTDFGFPYDYGSIMHYSEIAFSANGKPTIVPLNESWVGKLGFASEMSKIDVEKLVEMYLPNCVEPNTGWIVWVAVPFGILVLGAVCGGAKKYKTKVVVKTYIG